MEVNNFSLLIAPEQYSKAIAPAENDNGQVEMAHGQVYGVRCINNWDRRCQVTIEVDGVNVGRFQMSAHDDDVIYHPARDQGCFTFYKLGSAEGKDSALQDDEQLGLVKATFVPEKIQPQGWAIADDEPVYRGGDGSKGIATRGVSAGGTGLSGQSGQQFGTAMPIEEDRSQITVIHLRLVCVEAKSDRPRPLRSNAIPPRP